MSFIQSLGQVFVAAEFGASSCLDTHLEDGPDVSDADDSADSMKPRIECASAGRLPAKKKPPQVTDAPVMVEISAARFEDARRVLADLLPPTSPALSISRWGDSEKLLARAARIIANGEVALDSWPRIAEAGIAVSYPAAGRRATSGALAMFASQGLQPEPEKVAEAPTDHTPDIQKIATALKESRGNIARAARLAGISYTILWRLMGKYEFRRSVQRILRQPEIVQRDARWKVGEKNMAEALARRNGRRDLAARDIGMNAHVVGDHVRDAVPDSLLERFQERPAVVVKSDEEIAAALAVHKGNRRLAAIYLGMSQSGVSGRIMSADRKSPLFKYVHVKDRSSKSEGEIAAALRMCDGNHENAAKMLGISPEGVNYRVRHAKGSELKGFKVKPKAAKCSDLEIAEALARHNGNRELAAKELGMKGNSVRVRIMMASRRPPENNPLFYFKKNRR